MERIIAIIYLIIVFLLAVVYLLYHIHREVDRHKTKAPESEKPSEPIPDIVGKSYTVFLTPELPANAEPIKPVMSEDLEREPAIEPEPDISPGEVDAKLDQPYIPDEDDLDIDSGDDTDDSGDLSQGLTFEQINQAVEVIEGKRTSPNDELKAGETLSSMPSDLLEFVTMQENYLFMVNKLVAGYLDHANRKKPKPMEEFDINRYVP